MDKLNFYGAKNYNFYSCYFVFQQRRSEMERRETDEHDRKESLAVRKKRYKKNNYFSDEEDFSE